MNPNNCATCEWRELREDGAHCYMFKDEPTTACAKHTGHLSLRSIAMADLIAAAVTGLRDRSRIGSPS